MEVCGEFRQIGICIRLDLDVSLDTYGVYVNDLIEARPFLGLSLDSEDVFAATGCPVFADQPFLGPVLMPSA
jgi:hypothetical protein